MCINMAANILQGKALSFCSSLTFPLFQLKCQFIPDSMLSALPLIHILQKSFSLSLCSPSLHFLHFIFLFFLSPCHLLLSFPLLPPFAFTRHPQVLIIPSSVHITTSLSFNFFFPLPTPLSPPFLSFFSRPCHCFLIGSLIGHSA